MKRMITTLALAAAMLLATATAALAGEPTCSDVEALAVANHGEHITRDYVGVFGNAGGGRPAHFGGGVGPGASFCLPQSQSPNLP